MWGISGLVENRLASQDGLCSMEQRHGVTQYRHLKCGNFFVIPVKHIAYTCRRRRQVHSALRCMPYYVWKYPISLTIQKETVHTAVPRLPVNSVYKKDQLDDNFVFFISSSNSCSTCFGQPCAHHQELTTVWCYSLVLVCAVAAGKIVKSGWQVVRS